MLTAPVIEDERIVPVPADFERQTAGLCTVCQSESGVSFPLTEHTCESFAGMNDETGGFVTFSSRDLNSIYKDLRPRPIW